MEIISAVIFLRLSILFFSEISFLISSISFSLRCLCFLEPFCLLPTLITLISLSKNRSLRSLRLLFAFKLVIIAATDPPKLIILQFCSTKLAYVFPKKRSSQLFLRCLLQIKFQIPELPIFRPHKNLTPCLLLQPF